MQILRDFHLGFPVQSWSPQLRAIPTLHGLFAQCSRFRSNGNSRLIAITLMIASVAGSPVLTWADTEPGDRAELATSPSTSDLIAQLIAEQSDAATRSAAAVALVERAQSQSLAALAKSLESDTPNGVRVIVCRAIAEAVDPPPGLSKSIASAVENANEEMLPEVLSAAARYRTRSVVASVIGRLSVHPQPQGVLRAKLLETLQTQTAALEPEASVDQWIAWWEAARWLSQEKWYAELTDHLASRAAQLASENDALCEDFITAHRRIYALTPNAERSALLVTMLDSSRSELRALGFDLARRALLNAQTLDPSVADAAVAHLTDPSPLMRAEAASLITLLDADRYSDRVAHALAKETDETAAAAMLRCVAQHAEPGLEQVVVKWMATDGPARGPAVEAALTLRRNGLIEDAHTLEQIRELLVARLPNLISPAGVMLLPKVGSALLVSDLLDSPRPDIAAAAARALADDPAGLETLLSAALQKPALYNAAVDAVINHNPTATGYAAIAALPAIDEQSRKSALERVAKALPTTELLKVAEKVTDPEERALILSSVPPLSAPASSIEEVTARVLLTQMLADARLKLNDPGGALEAMPYGTIAEDAEVAPMFDPMRVSALLWLNRIADAEAVCERTEVPASAWLDGLEWALDMPHAPAIMSAIDRRFKGSLGATESTRFAKLRAMLPQVEDEGEIIDGVGPTP